MGKTATAAAAAGLLILGFVIGAAGHTAAAKNTAPPPAAATAASRPPVAPAPTPAVVFAATGNGIKKTAAFTTGPEWSVAYTFNCAGFGGTGNFILEADNGGDTLANALAPKGADISYEHDSAGTHYLSVNSECDWTLKVVDG